MKRIIIAVIVMAAAVLSAFAVCGQAEVSETAAPKYFDPEQVKTFADIFSFEDREEYQEAYSEKKYTYVFSVDDIYYRASVDLPEKISEAIWAIDFFDDEREQKIIELISPLEIKEFENLTEQIPAQDELDKLTGLSGKDLFDNGWTYSSYNLEDMEAGMYHGPFEYTVRFAYDGEKMKNTDDFDFYEEFKDLTVISVQFTGMGDAADLE